jgi:hypothetical protein
MVLPPYRLYKLPVMLQAEKHWNTQNVRKLKHYLINDRNMIFKYVLNIFLYFCSVQSWFGALHLWLAPGFISPSSAPGLIWIWAQNICISKLLVYIKVISKMCKTLYKVSCLWLTSRCIKSRLGFSWFSQFLQSNTSAVVAQLSPSHTGAQCT